MRGAQKWSLLLWQFYTLLPSLKLDIPTALANLYAPSLPPSLPHIPPPHTRHVHPQKQRAVRCVGARVCIYSDDCVLLLVVHPAIEPFTTRNSVPSVKRCGVCKLPRLLPASYHQISSGSMMRFSPVLTLGPALMSIKLKTFSINQVSIAIVVVLMDYCS